MKRMLGIVVIGLCLTVAGARGDDIVAGTWKISVISTFNGNSETTSWLLKLENKDGKTTATLAAADPRFKAPKLVSFHADGKTVRAVLNNGFSDATFEGAIADGGKKIVGVYGTESSPAPAVMVPTDLTTLGLKDVNRPLGIEPMQQATTLENQARFLRFKADQAKDAMERKTLLDEAAEADKKANLEFREVIAKHGNTVAATIAMTKLITRTKAGEATAEDFAKWAEIASKTASMYGSVWQLEVQVKLCQALLVRKQNQLALDYAQQAEKNLDATAPLGRQVKVLDTLRQVLHHTGKSDAAKLIAAKIEKLEEGPDKQYKATVPSFKPDVFAGRKTDSKRVVVMELFTGAQCPPCVAADVAFDVLQQTYKTSELVMIQYHLHIPGPDAMTNSESEARWKHYREAHGSKQVGGVPTAVFNGKTLKGGGGPMGNAKNIYAAYRAIIDPLLDTPAACQVNATAKRLGNKIQIQAQVTGLQNPGQDKKLRLVLVEETVRYLGGNGIRFHHQVVRAMPGGAVGKALTEKNSRTEEMVDVQDLRKTLSAYLDDFVMNQGLFPQPWRPMNLVNLRVLALVQDDATHEILQATQVEVVE
jgi:hypothetical protein